MICCKKKYDLAEMTEYIKKQLKFENEEFEYKIEKCIPNVWTSKIIIPKCKCNKEITKQ